MRCAESKG